MWELAHKESWVPKNWCFWTVVLEKILESPLDCKEIQAVHPKGKQPWIFIGRTDAEAETPLLWPPDGKSWLTGKDSDAGKDWRQDEQGTTEDEMAGWHHWLNGHEFEQAQGVGDGQGVLVCCSLWGHKESDVTERLSWKIQHQKRRTHIEQRGPGGVWKRRVESWRLREKTRNAIQFEGSTLLKDEALFLHCFLYYFYSVSLVWRAGGGLLTALAVSPSVDSCYFFLLLFHSFPVAPSTAGEWAEWFHPRSAAAPSSHLSYCSWEHLLQFWWSKHKSCQKRSPGQSFHMAWAGMAGCHLKWAVWIQ